MWFISWKSTKTDAFSKNLQLFEKTTIFLAFRWTFRLKLDQTASFGEKARKTIDLAKTMQLFLTNYHRLGLGLGLGLTETLTLTPNP